MQPANSTASVPIAMASGTVESGMPPKIASFTTRSVFSGDSSTHPALPVDACRTRAMAAAKNTIPA